MEYYFSKNVKIPFDEVIEKVTEALKEEGFGVLTDIDVAATMKKKLDKDMPAYRILGACNPHFAFQAIQAEDKVGVMLPCNVIVQDKGDHVEVSAVDPMASMQAIDNEKLVGIAGEVKTRLQKVVETL